MAVLQSTFVVLATLFLLSSAAEVEDPFKAENDLVATLADAGSTGGWKVGRACETCRKGLFATRSVKSGDVIGQIDLHQCIDLDTREHFMATLIYKVFYEPDVNETYGAYLKTLPDPSKVNCYMTISEEQIELLQDSDYTFAINDHQEYASTILNDLLTNGPEHGLTWEPTLEQIKYYMGLAVTRGLEFHEDLADEEGEVHSYLCPILDLANHGSPGNADHVQFENGTAALIATADIAEGDEITVAYNTGTTARPDMQLLVHGFLADENVEQPLLSGIDMPDFDTDNPFFPSDDGDDLTGLSHTEAAEELERVSETLQALPTTEEEDAKIVEEGKYKDDFFSEQIVKWRILRKRALKQRKEALEQLVSEL